MNKNFSFKKIIKIVSLSLFLFFITYYFIAFFDTNELMDYVGEVIEGEVSYEEIKNEPIESYYYKGCYDDFSSVEFDNTRIFVWHNFSKGYIWMHEWHRIENNNGELVSASGSPNWPRYYEPLTKWTIQKENGTWKITNIDSHP